MFKKRSHFNEGNKSKIEYSSEGTKQWSYSRNHRVAIQSMELRSGSGKNEIKKHASKFKWCKVLFLGGFDCIFNCIYYFLSQILPDVFGVILHPGPVVDRQTWWSHGQKAASLYPAFTSTSLSKYLSLLSIILKQTMLPRPNHQSYFSRYSSWEWGSGGGGVGGEEVFHMRRLPPQQAVFKERNRWLLVEGTWG